MRVRLVLLRSLAAAAALCLHGTGYAQSWEPVADSDTALYLIDRSSLVPAGGRVSGWVLVTGPQGTRLPDYGSRTQLMVFDCGARALALKAYEVYARPGGQGALLHTETYDEAALEFTPTSAESVGEKLLEAACSR